MQDLQRSLVVFKPDAVSRSIVWEVLSRFEKLWYKIVGMKMMQPDRDFWYYHYETIGAVVSRRGEKVFEGLLEIMTTTPVIAMVLEWVDTVENVRKIVGKTEPFSSAPGTIRWDYAHMSFSYADATQKWLLNIVHASWNAEEAQKEIDHWFKKEELFDYLKPNDTFFF